MLVCTFAGHRQVFAADVAQKARDALERLVEIDRELTFYTGGMGEFDSLCAAAVRRLRARHPEARVRLYLVLPYLTAEVNRSGAYYEAAFDGVFVPPDLLGLHYKSAILRRNRWMVDRAQVLLSYVTRDFGGASATLRYAKTRPGLRIIDLAGA